MSKKFKKTIDIIPGLWYYIQVVRKQMAMRKCRNWQTSKTKDLVTIAVVWVQVPSSALCK